MIKPSKADKTSASLAKKKKKKQVLICYITSTCFIYCSVALGGHPESSEGESRQWSSITGLCGVGGAGCVACASEVMARGPLSLQLWKYGVISICVSITGTVAEEAQTYLVCGV